MTGLLAAGSASAQISPGPLSGAHAQLDSNDRCLDCHGGGDDMLERNCLTCHQEIRWLLEHRRGLHAASASEECADCHPEHAGRDFELIAWPDGAPEKLDHARTGWPLAGAHAAVACRDCHRANNRGGPVAPLLQRGDSGSSWLGLDRSCASCHTDPHAGRLGDDCETCHGPRSWKPAERFDHGTAAFGLEGRHRDVPCERCHLVPGKVFRTTADGEPAPLFKPVPHDECSSCHRDVHEARLGPDCSRCHTVEGFGIVPVQGFDHSKTRFSLKGKHASVSCERCHDRERAWGPRPRFQACGNCHADPHAGLATRRGERVDCRACHDERGFAVSTYSASDHAGSRYPLEGRHAQLRCRECHTRDTLRAELGPAGIDLRPLHATCRDCHEDAHRGQLNGREDGGACAACHTVEGWKPSRFTLAQHAVLRLTLEGAHAEAACFECHGPNRPKLPALPGPGEIGTAGVAFSLDAACVSCHADPHGGRLATDCRECHGVARFRPSTVDARKHAEFDYRLEGAHVAVPCNACHERLSSATPATASALTFEKPHETCESCHVSPHAGQFDHRADGGACEGCHDLDSFRPASRFDHVADARFRLDGAHRKVACAACHPTRADAEGREVTVYRPLARACKDCHATAGETRRR